MIFLIGVILGIGLGYSLKRLLLLGIRGMKKVEVVIKTDLHQDTKPLVPRKGGFVDPVSMSERLEQAKTPEDLLPQNKIDFPWE